MSQQKSNRARPALVALAITASLSVMSLSGACTDEDGDGFDNSYNNHVELSCNGSVIVDEIFTTLESCQAFRDANTFMCGDIQLSVNC